VGSFDNGDDSDWGRQVLQAQLFQDIQVESGGIKSKDRGALQFSAQDGFVSERTPSGSNDADREVMSKPNLTSHPWQKVLCPLA